MLQSPKEGLVLIKTEFYWIQLREIGSSIDDLRAGYFNQGPDIVMNRRVVHHNDGPCISAFITPEDGNEILF